MSNILNTSVAPFCHSQDDPGSVPVTACDYAAGFAPEGSFSESEWLLGSRETLGTRHGCIGGPDHHHLPASPLGTVDQFSPGRADSCISGFPGHCGFGKKLQLEVFHRDQVVIVGDVLGPHAGVVLRLPGRFLVQLGSFPSGTLVAI